MNHDMAVWQTVKGLRRTGSSILESGAFFLTLDYMLYRFDWESRRSPKEFGLVILANQFMQLLRPFVPTSTEADQQFMEIFAAAEFRTAVTDYTTTSSKVLSYLSSYSDLSQPTAVRILTDEVLMHELQEVDEESEEFQKLIDSKLVRDNEELLRRTEELRLKSVEAEQRAAQSEATANKTLEELRSLKERSASAEAREQQTHLIAIAAKERLDEADRLIRGKEDQARQILQEKTAEVDALAKHIDTLKTRLRIVASIGFCLLGMGGILIVAKFVRWDWLNNHQNRLGLYGCAILIVASITWAIADSNKTRRTIALLPLGISVVAVLLQILGR